MNLKKQNEDLQMRKTLQILKIKKNEESLLNFQKCLNHVFTKDQIEFLMDLKTKSQWSAETYSN